MDKIDLGNIDISAVTEVEDVVDDMHRELQVAKQKRAFYDLLGKLVPTTGVVIAVIGAIVYFFFYKNGIVLTLSILYLAIAIIYPVFPVGGIVNTEVEVLESEIALKATGADALEQRAERLFKAHEIGLRRYYNQTLRHSSAIFLAGIICICIGFSIIGVTLYFVWYGPADSYDEKLVGTVLGIVSGILSNFISVIFLRMFSETMKSLAAFHEKLVGTNHLHFANFLAAKIDDKEKKNEVLAKLATTIAQGNAK